MSLIRELRIRRGWSQEVLSRHVQCSRQYIAHVERKDVLPSLWLLHRIARALGVSDATLLLDCITTPRSTATSCDSR